MPILTTIAGIVSEGLMIIVSQVIRPVLEKLGISLLSRHTEKKLPSVWRWLRFRGRSRLLHLKELTASIEKMPFIYKGLDIDILNGFVDIDYASLDLKTYKPKQTVISASTTKELILKVELKQTLQRSNKTLFLGNAGVGKTTFQRYQLLRFLSGEFEYCQNSNNYIPFFVSLKFINNDVRFPIRNYLLNHFSYLASAGAMQLTKLAQQGRLFLFLDGFDEVPFSRESGRNFCHEELELMICEDTISRAHLLKVPPEIIPFYSALVKSTTNHIWLSCRTGFYQQHALSSSPTYPIENSLFALELRGIGKYRSELVRKIFDRYRNNETISKNLSEQYFLDQLDADPLSELHKLSYIPLFLTVMSYNYVQKVIEDRTYKVQVAASVDTLIRECIALLLKDIDEQKARNLSDLEREIQIKTRNNYLEEKEKFLPFFAAQLFVDNKTVFDVGYIIKQVHAFFRLFPDLQNKEKILRELDGKSTEPSFADQLINCGIFVLTEVRNGIASYDFPHQRFKEFLASEFFAESNSNFLMEHIKEKGLGELISVFFKVSRNRDMVLKRLLELIVADPASTNYYQLILVECLQQAPANYDVTPTLYGFLDQALDKDREFDFVSEFKSFFKPNEEFIDKLRQQFRKGWLYGKGATLKLCCQLLAHYNKPLLTQLLTEAFNLEDESKDETIIRRRVNLLSTYNADLLNDLTKTMFQIIIPSNEEKLEKYSGALLTYQPIILRNRLTEVFRRSIENDDWHTLHFCCAMLKKYQPNTLNILFTRHFDNLIENNSFDILPESFLTYYRRSDELFNRLTEELDQLINGEKLFALCLCMELFLRFDQRHLTRVINRYIPHAFDSRQTIFVQLLISSPPIKKYLKESKTAIHTIKLLDQLLDLYPFIKKANVEAIPFAHEGNHPLHCYIITDKTLRQIELWLRLKGSQLDYETWIWFTDNRYKVFFSSDYLTTAPGQFDPWFARIFSSATKIDYPAYTSVMRAVETLIDIISEPIIFFPKS